MPPPPPGLGSVAVAPLVMKAQVVPRPVVHPVALLVVATNAEVTAELNVGAVNVTLPASPAVMLVGDKLSVPLLTAGAAKTLMVTVRVRVAAVVAVLLAVIVYVYEPAVERSPLAT